ncbi:MAG TPA: YlxR family protein [Acidimicrobiia bacterium]
MCVGCRRRAEPSALDRVARSADGGLAVGRTQPGRGAWFCSRKVECFDVAVRRKALQRALRCELTDHQIETLRAKLYGAAPERGMKQ